MKRSKLISFLFFVFFTTYSYSQITGTTLEKTNSFFPGWLELNHQNIEWYYLNIPENWEKPEGKKNQLAVAKIKCVAKGANSNPVVFIAGGPGGGAISGLGGWLGHPLRKESDIILVDLRGTGFSKPALCPGMGKDLLQILARNENSLQDDSSKLKVAMDCKEELIQRGIDIQAYNSKSIVKDLNTLKTALNYTEWNVYGVSYGTYIAQVYVNTFPADVKSLILDSSIPDISQYYNHNTSNYISSLNRIFEYCKKDPGYNKQYPDLEETYYATIRKLEKKPLMVNVSKKIIPDGKFTYNAEDFKIAIQQALYNKQLIEILPLLITAFNNENKQTLGTLVEAFSGALGLDYGTYYCVTCNEAIPFNSLSEFNKDADKNDRIHGGLSFYKSDFSVCEKWNTGLKIDTVASLPNQDDFIKPVLVFSGEFDPITPLPDGEITAGKFKNSYWVKFPSFGHGPGFSVNGYNLVYEFVKNPEHIRDVKPLVKDAPVRFITGIKINGGISKFAQSLGQFNILFFSPLIMALLIMLFSIVAGSISVIRKRDNLVRNRLLSALLIFTSLAGLILLPGLALAVNDTSKINFYILVFGLPDKFNYLFVLKYLFFALTLIASFVFLGNYKKIINKSIIASVLFSYLVVIMYFYYWGL